MNYLSVKEAAQIWGISEQMVRKKCNQGKVPGAIQSNKGWQIPEDISKPGRTETVSKTTLPKLANRLQKQKKKKNYHGLYDYIQIYFTYCSSRMASNRLTMDQVELIFKKGKVISRFEPLKVSDCIEAMNHSVCIDYIIDHVMDSELPGCLLWQTECHPRWRCTDSYHHLVLGRRGRSGRYQSHLHHWRRSLQGQFQRRLAADNLYLRKQVQFWFW